MTYDSVLDAPACLHKAAARDLQYELVHVPPVVLVHTSAKVHLLSDRRRCLFGHKLYLDADEACMHMHLPP